MERQKARKGETRPRLSPSVEREVNRRIRADARRFKVSISFATNLALADHLGITVERPRSLRNVRRLSARRRSA